ncbi:MAG: polysaccharide pyruvyl transferase family protein [Lachnospiraceae bacterium]|jgi:Polysaccharide pyruvyl transferase.|nr:polysaccharide pyruvyl transferase family protein [Lachnospiraceae bacterium]
MKVGIISINAHTKVLNFASPLHSYAFQQFLQMNGIESVIIDYKPNYYGQFNPRHPYFYYRKHPVKNKKKQKAIEHKWLKLFLARQKRFDKFQHFIDRYYVTTDKCYNHKLLDTEDLGLDCYICATDVIWKCNKNAGFDRGFFLACDSMKGKYKIAYAASRGPVVELDKEKQQLFLEYISEFQHISVREESLGNYIESISDIKVTHVLDPVLLHEKEFYEPIIKRPGRKKGYVLLYVVMESAIPLIELAVAFAEKNGLEVIELSENMADAKIPAGTHHKVVYDIGIEEWLGYMDEAEYIFTNSFHATCFSILFHKQFFVGKRNGDKILSVMEMFGLSGRKVEDCFEGSDCIAKEIDFAPVDVLRREYMQKSSDFILSALEDAEQFVSGQKKQP